MSLQEKNKTIKPSEKMVMVYTTNTIRNNCHLTTIFFFFCSVFWDVSLGFTGFNKPPIEGNQLPVETNRHNYSFQSNQYKSHYNQ